MPTKIVTYGNSLDGTRYQVFINANGQGGTGFLECPMIDISYSYDLNDRRADAELMPSTCNLVILLMDQNQRVALNDALTGKEGENTITVLRDNAVDWIGGIMTGLSGEEDAPYPQEFTIKATDGVARLKDTPYNFGGLGVNEFVVVTDHFKRILELCPNSKLYNSGELFVRFNSTMWPDLLTPDNTINLFSKLRISVKAFRTVDKKGEVTFMSAYDVLVQTLRAFGLRLVYAKGVFHIFEISNATRVDEPVVWHEYDVDMASIGTTTLADWSTESNKIVNNLVNSASVKMLSGGRIMPQAPTRRVELTYKHYSRQNLTAQSTWSYLNTAPSGILNFQSGGGTSLRITGSIRPTVIPPPGSSFPSVPVHVIINMNLYVDDGAGNIEALTRTYNYAAGIINYNETEWVSGDANTATPIAATASSFGAFSTQFTIETPPVPQDGDLFIGFRLGAILAAGSPYTGADTEYFIENVFVESLIDGSNDDQYNYNTWGINNPDFNENSLVDKRDLLIGDGPLLNTFGRIQAKTGAGVSDWDNTQGWRHYVDGAYLSTSVPHTHLLALDLLFIRNLPQDQLDTAFIAPNYFAHHLLRRSNQVFLLQRGTFRLLSDEVSGTWLQIGYNQPGIIPTDDEQEFIGLPPGVDVISNVPEPIAVDDATNSPPLGGPQLGHNTVVATLDEGIAANVPTTILDIDALPADLPLQAGDQIILTHPYTGQTQVVTVAVDYIDGVVNPWVTAGGLDWTTPSGGTWTVDTTPGLQVEEFTPAFDFPEGTYVQIDQTYDVVITTLTKTEHEDFHLFGATTPLSVGVLPIFWRSVRREGYRIEGISFALFDNANATDSVIQVKYTSAANVTGVVAEYDGSDLTQYYPTEVNVLPGVYTFEVVSMSGTAPNGLVITFQLRKQITE